MSDPQFDDVYEYDDGSGSGLLASIASEVEEAEKEAEKEEAKAERLRILTVTQHLEYDTAYNGVKEWLNKWHERQVLLRLASLKTDAHCQILTAPPDITSVLLKNVLKLIDILEKYIQNNDNKPFHQREEFKHKIITMDEVCELWIHGDDHHRQMTRTPLANTPSPVEFLWVAAIYGYIATNPRRIHLGKVKSEIEFYNAFRTISTVWRQWPLEHTMEVPAIYLTLPTDEKKPTTTTTTTTPPGGAPVAIPAKKPIFSIENEAHRKAIFETIATYTAYALTHDFEEIKIEEGSVAMSLLVKMAETDAEEKATGGLGEEDSDDDESKVHDPLLTRETDSIPGAEEKKKEDKKMEKLRRQKEAANMGTLGGKLANTHANRKIVLEKCNTSLAENYRDWPIRCPIICIMMHACYEKVMKMHGPKTVQKQYIHSKLDSYIRCKANLTKFLYEHVPIHSKEDSKLDVAKIVYLTTLPLGVTEIQYRHPEKSGLELDYKSMVGIYHNDERASDLNKRMAKPSSVILRPLADAGANQAIQNMVVPGILLGQYQQWAHVWVSSKKLNWFNEFVISPKNFREALKNQVLTTYERYSEARRPIILIMGSKFYVHNFFFSTKKKGNRHLSRAAELKAKLGAHNCVGQLIEAKDVIDALAIWSHLMVIQFESKTETGIDMSKWFSKFAT